MSTEIDNPYAAPVTAIPFGAPVAAFAPPAPKPRIWTVSVALSLAIASSFGLQIAATVGIVFYLLATGVTPHQLQSQLIPLITSPGVFTLLVITGPGPFGVVALCAAWLSPEPVAQRLGLVPVRCSRSIYPLTMIGSIFPLAVGLGIATALAHFVPWIPTDETAAHLYEQMTLEWAVPFVLVIGFVPGFCEEFLFRGYVQRRLVQRSGPAAGIITASLLFGLAHVMPHVVIFATILGLYFGVIAWKSGSIWPCIACHFFVNSGLNAWRMVIKFGEVPDSVQWGVNIGAVALGVVCFAISLWVLFATRAPDTDASQIPPDSLVPLPTPVA